MIGMGALASHKDTPVKRSKAMENAFNIKNLRNMNVTTIMMSFIFLIFSFFLVNVYKQTPYITIPCTEEIASISGQPVGAGGAAAPPH